MLGSITNMTKEKLLLELHKREIACNQEQANQLVAFMHHVLSWNEKFNLTAIKDEDAFMEKMIFDSAIALTDLDLSEKKAIDIGTGAGFPGVIIYLLNPKVNLTLLDSTSKKIELLKSYAKENGYNYEAVAARAEEYARNHREKYDYVFARAVAPLNILLELCVPLLKVGGSFIAMKGPGLEEELELCSNALKKLNCHIHKVIEDELPDSFEKRNLIYITKDKATPNKYPREYKDIKKLPL